jgi:putative transposase
MEHMAGRKRNFAEEIVRKLRRADELAAEGKTGEEIAAELQVSPATLYNWRRTYGGLDTDAAKELKELREQNARLKRLLAEAEREKDALREVAKENSEPSCQAPRRGHAQDDVEHVGAVGVQGCWAGPLHLPPPAAGADPGRSGRRNEGLAARLRHQTPLPRIPARLGGAALRRAP